MMTIKFRTDNAAFDDKEEECIWILRVIAYEIENGDTDGVITDSNGNKIGHWSY